MVSAGAEQLPPGAVVLPAKFVAFLEAWERLLRQCDRWRRRLCVPSPAGASGESVDATDDAMPTGPRHGLVDATSSIAAACESARPGTTGAHVPGLGRGKTYGSKPVYSRLLGVPENLLVHVPSPQLAGL